MLYISPIFWMDEWMDEETDIQIHVTDKNKNNP